MSAPNYENMGSLELRKAAREVCSSKGLSSSWTAYAKREQTLAFLEAHANGETPEPPVNPVSDSIIEAGKTEETVPQVVGKVKAAPDASNVLAGLQALISGALASAGSVNESRVREIVKETAFDRDKLTELVKTLVAESDIVPQVSFILRDGTKIEVPGIKHPATETICALAASGVRTWIHGPAGTGKTTMARSIAEAAGMTVFCQPPSLTRYDVLGYMDAHGKVIETPVSRFVKHDGPKCLLFDEVDSWGDGAQLAANLLLANGHAELPDGTHRLVRDGSPFWVVATANTTGKGAKSAYVGRKRMDGAFLDRFDAFPLVDLHEPTERKIAKGIIAGSSADEKRKDAAEDAIAVSVKIRAQVKSLGIDLSWSPRKTFALCQLVLGGMETKAACAVLLGATDKAAQILSAVTQ